MNSRLISIIRKEFIQIFRDPRTLVLIIVMPMHATVPAGLRGDDGCKKYLHCGLGSEPLRPMAGPCWMRSARQITLALIMLSIPNRNIVT